MRCVTSTMNILKNCFLTIGACLALGTTLLGSSCSKSESYSDLLKEEEKAVNWYLANHRVETEIPKDGNFETGTDAPFYKMDDDGYIYMQVISKGDPDEKVVAGDKVYFLYTRWNIKNLYELGASQSDSNTMTGTLSEYYFFYGDTSSGNGLLYGKGMQLPLKYLNYHSEVNLVLKSYEGFSIDQSECTPYVVNVKYLKPEY